MVFIKGAEGDLGIAPGHLQLLTRIAPGPVRVLPEEGEEVLLYVSGGIVEIQPDKVSILADTVERPQDVNEAAAIEAKRRAEKLLTEKGIDRKHTQQDLMEALAKLRVLELARARRKRR